MIEAPSTLRTTLKRLKLSGVLDTLPERVAWTRENGLTEMEFLELILQDEIDRRDQKNFMNRLVRAGFELDQTLENFQWDAAVRLDRKRVRDLFGLTFLERREDVLFMGPVGVGKTFLASALGHTACRAGYQVLFLRADQMLKNLLASRADNSTEKVLRSLLAPDLLIVDDFGLRRLNPMQSSDFYEVIVQRHRRSSTIVTSNRSVEEWIPLFDDPMLAQSALDRLAHNAHQVVIDGESFRTRLRPGAKSIAQDPNPKKKVDTKKRS